MAAPSQCSHNALSSQLDSSHRFHMDGPFHWYPLKKSHTNITAATTKKKLSKLHSCGQCSVHSHVLHYFNSELLLPGKSWEHTESQILNNPHRNRSSCTAPADATAVNSFSPIHWERLLSRHGITDMSTLYLVI